MFDLRFFAIVHKILHWTNTPTNHYANEHEQHMEKTTKTPLYLRMMEEFVMMPPELQRLHLYVSKTYPAYFSLALRMSGAASQAYQTVY